MYTLTAKSKINLISQKVIKALYGWDEGVKYFRNFFTEIVFNGILAFYLSLLVVIATYLCCLWGAFFELINPDTIEKFGPALGIILGLLILILGVGFPWAIIICLTLLAFVNVAKKIMPKPQFKYSSVKIILFYTISCLIMFHFVEFFKFYETAELSSFNEIAKLSHFELKTLMINYAQTFLISWAIILGIDLYYHYKKHETAEENL